LWRGSSARPQFTGTFTDSGPTGPRNSFPHKRKKLEARAGIEPANRGFADLGLTTWLPRHEQENGTCRKNWSLASAGLRRRRAQGQGSEDVFTPPAGLLQKIRARRGKEPVDTPLLRVHERKAALRSACQAAGVKPITHHDLRHLFATRCIESGVDIPTVSRRLGHSDGGALAMRTYDHLRQEHSTAQAAKVHY
jgi:integrase